MQSRAEYQEHNRHAHCELNAAKIATSTDMHAVVET